MLDLRKLVDVELSLALMGVLRSVSVSQDLTDFPIGMFRPKAVSVPLAWRDRLISVATGPAAPRLTLISAPTGYGKTVLLSQLHESLIGQGRRCLWLSVSMVTGGLTLLELLWAAADHAGVPKAVRPSVTANGLLARIERCAEPVAIIIDGIHPCLPPGSDLFLEQLIRCASDGISFLISTATASSLSTVRLEAAGKLQTIGARELALDETDIAALGQRMALPDWALAFNARIEGWPAIFQLAIHRFRDEPDLTESLLAGLQNDLEAFFRREVLGELDDDELDRLLDASVVDVVSGPLLDALSHRHDGRSILNRLVERGLPITTAKNREWFRLHPLLRKYGYDHERQRDDHRLRLRHQRAANWLLASGDTQGALRHATASGNIHFLRTTYQRSMDTPIRLQGQPMTSLVVAVPPGPLRDVTSDRKWRTVFDLIETGQLNKARTEVAAIRHEAPALIGANLSDTPVAEWEPVFVDLLMQVFDDRLPKLEQVEALRDQLMRTPGIPPSIPAAVSELVVVSRFRRGDLSSLELADHDLWHTIALAPTQAKIYVLMELGIAAMERCDLDLAERHLKTAEAAALAAYGPDASQALAARTLLIELAFERGDGIAGKRLLQQSFFLLRDEEIWFNLAASAFTTLSALAAQISWNDTLETLDLAQPLATNIGLWRLPPVLIAQRLRLAVIWGRNLQVAEVDREDLSRLGLLDISSLDSAGLGWRVAVPAQLAAIRFDLAAGQVKAALARSIALRPILEARRQVRRLIELDLLQGRAFIEAGNHVLGHSLVRAALKTSVCTGMVQVFSDEARLLGTIIGDLLLAQDVSAEERAFLDRLAIKPIRTNSRPTRFTADGEVFELSSREAQLLKAMTTGRTFKEIAFALNISINTINMHRTRLYKKLNCNSRSQATSIGNRILK